MTLVLLYATPLKGGTTIELWRKMKNYIPRHKGMLLFISPLNWESLKWISKFLCCCRSIMESVSTCPWHLADTQRHYKRETSLPLSNNSSPERIPKALSHTLSNITDRIRNCLSFLTSSSEVKSKYSTFCHPVVILGSLFFFDIWQDGNT